jgi:hypothetical protein
MILKPSWEQSPRPYPVIDFILGKYGKNAASEQIDTRRLTNRCRTAPFGEAEGFWSKQQDAGYRTRQSSSRQPAVAVN